MEARNDSLNIPLFGSMLKKLQKLHSSRMRSFLLWMTFKNFVRPIQGFEKKFGQDFFAKLFATKVAGLKINSKQDCTVGTPNVQLGIALSRRKLKFWQIA